MSSSLEVLPVKIRIPEQDDLNPVLPPHAFLMGIIAPPRSGKTNLIMNLLLNEQFYYNKKKAPYSYFDEVMYLSPTSPFDKTCCEMLPKLENLIQISDPDELVMADTILNQITKEQAEAEPEDRKKLLVIMDDMVGIIDKLPKLQQISTKFRHYSLSIIIVSQSYRKIPSVIRNCFTCMIVFDLKNEKEFTKIQDEFTGSIPNSEKMIQQIVNKRYDFFYFNIERQQLYHNFHTLMWSRDENEMQKGGVSPAFASPPSSPPPTPKTPRIIKHRKQTNNYPI
tara:strand:+ start:1135 stop:1977 length:843 start_codon:yes stop_codon:yes gene_type:complete